ncbi:MAG: amino acid ABC transporter substrate-binding protein [Acetobacterales bacterium]
MLEHWKCLIASLAVAAVAMPSGATAQSGGMLKVVKDRGELVCGVNQGRYGFASADDRGKWTGLDVDFCRAVAAAVLGDSEKVRYIPLSSVQRFPALQSGEVDILSRTTTINLTRDAALGFNFSPVTFYTGTGFMVRKDLNVTKVDEMDGATICVLPGSTTEKNVSSLFAARNMTYNAVVIEKNTELVSAYLSGRCDVLSMDQAGLPGHRRFDAPNPDEHFILPGVFSKEPLALAVRHGDDQWYDIIKWAVMATFEAEETGVSSENVDKMLESDNPAVKRLLGKEGDLGKKLGLDNEWAYRIIKQVGNYEDIYERGFGKKSPLDLERGLNSLWTKGGLLYSYPFN